MFRSISAPIRGASVALALVFSAAAGAHGETAADTRYSGRATVIDVGANVTTLGSRIVLGDTGELDPLGATRETTAVTLTNPPPTQLSAKSITAITSGANFVAASSAAVQKLSLQRGALSISADVIEADATATCDPYTMTVKPAGSSHIANLRINGRAWPVTGKPNQKIAIPGVATIIVNEQSRPDVNTMSVTALHVIVPGIAGLAGADVKISHARAGILACPCI